MKVRSTPRRTASLVLALFFAGLGVLFLAACSGGGSGHHGTSHQEFGTQIPVNGGHIAITLRDENGDPIDITQAAAPPYSPKQTCGACHSYHTIEEGFHFQQGADFLSDNYGATHDGFEWELSPGMLGKW